MGWTQIPPPAGSGSLVLLTLPDNRVRVWSQRLKVFFLGPQKNGVANTATTNGKAPRDLGFQDTGKQGMGVR